MKNTIVFGIISSRQCLIGGRGILGVISDSNPIMMKFGMKVKFEVLNNFQKFGCDQLIGDLASTHTKKFR